jgi:hypothetical protein
MNQIQFIDFLTKLAPEGETALLVRQKPQLRGGELQFHADGAIKCTWPAMLPAAKIKPDWAIYGNTASFIVDRFEEGHVSASAANCEYVLVMVLDDVGSDKAPNTPALTPTWKIETSPDSFQWGYVFSEQPSKAEFSAAIKAISAAGYTDPGACNAVRNFRIPGSINLKPNKNQFAAVLTEINPDLEYTLAEICEALGVVPGEAEGDGPKPIRIADNGGDDVFAWLSEQGMVISKPNPEGWAGIFCPNAQSHTDGNPEGRYMPATRSYCCLHGHCVEFDTKAFLAWVAENGGPAHDGGLRDDLLASAMEAALAKLEPSDMFTDDAQKIIDEVEQRELGRIEKSQWYERFAYVADDDAYFDIQTRREVSRGTFNACSVTLPAGRSTRVAVSRRRSGLMRTVKRRAVRCWSVLLTPQATRCWLRKTATYSATVGATLGPSSTLLRRPSTLGSTIARRWCQKTPSVSTCLT